ncbi:sensor histidine kinase [Catenisphaera adipataccumulans]|jgi:two-component system sensor histidine kinase CiaH|uniref:histidine kinase n=1 Tax=Catenisphaera adipataccumulans TaxID=700500 RepID=A0A7W8CW32_9FIRM|nr:ATP-binding protein [Catenisphaera adipataccumulans]MBB5182386.1 signal transduction histidine kinase [Catenisphaera adipataccumulans]
MIRKLRRKFIAITMLFVVMVLVFVFGMETYTNYKRIQSGIEETFEYAMNPANDSDSFSPGSADDHEPKHMGNVVTIDVTSDYELVNYSSGVYSMSDEDVEDVIDIVQGQPSSGMLKEDSNIYYRRKKTGDGYRIVVIDARKEVSNMRSQLIVSVELGVAACAAFFVLAYFLSGWILKPVQDSWDRQKRFVADTSHELKTPLTVILADSDILLEHDEETVKAQKQWVQSIQSEAMRMKKLVEDLLFLAKHDANRVPKQKIRCDLSEIAMSCTLPCETIAYEKELTLESEIEDDLIYSGDPNQFKQFMMIFLDNAIKYTPKGGVIHFKLYREGGKIRMMVQNSGSYIPPEAIPHLFERFYRVDKSRVYEGGYGLGLAIAKEIADMYHIHIKATSSKENGTCFSFIFEG